MLKHLLIFIDTIVPDEDTITLFKDVIVVKLIKVFELKTPMTETTEYAMLLLLEILISATESN